MRAPPFVPSFPFVFPFPLGRGGDMDMTLPQVEAQLMIQMTSLNSDDCAFERNCEKSLF